MVEAGAGLLATGSRDPSVWLWTLGDDDARGATPCARLEGHSHSATALLAPAPGELWSGSRDRTVRIWRLEDGTGECRRVLRGHEGAVLHLVGTPSGMVASASSDGTIRAWTRGGDPAGVLEAGGGWVWALASLGGSLVASGSEDGALHFWDLERARPVGEIGRAGAPVRSLIALPGRDGLASGHTDGRIRLWYPSATDPRGPWALKRELAGHDADVRALAAFPGGDGHIASASEDGTIRVWDPEGEGSQLLGRHADFVTGLSVLADGRLASASYDGTVKLWAS